MISGGFKIMRFIESILFKDGSYHHLDLHQKRMNRTLKQFAKASETVRLRSILPHLSLDGLYKVRVVYTIDGEGVHYDIEFASYVPRKIHTLEVVLSEEFDYSFKYEDRTLINGLLHESKGDDIIIVLDGQITDSSYANLVFWDGERWVTSNTPLLNGVKRQLLLKEGEVKEAPISVSDLTGFEKVSLINAMLDLGTIEIPMSRVLQ